MNKQSLAKNYFFQFSYQVLVLVVPLIISPYLTRTLKENALGMYTYINSISFYFLILANLGIGVYGKRAISRIIDDSERLRKTFWSLLYVHIGSSVVAVLLYIAFISFFVNENQSIYYINAIYVISAMFDITWFYYGIENFSSVVIKNAVVKVVGCVLIFAFVKSPDDLWKYTLIMASTICLGQAIMIPQATKLVKPTAVTRNECIVHIKPILFFSIAIIASSLYTVFDKTLLGLLSTKDSVAFYEYSNQIIMVPQTFVGVIGTVMFPRACKLVSMGLKTEQRKLMNISFLITAFIGIGSMFGLLAIAKEFAVIYFGESFASCGGIMMALSPLVYIIGTGSVLRSQCLIPNGMDKQFNFSILYNAIINIVLSLSLIPRIGVYGAVIGTFSAELFGLVYQLYICKSFISISDLLKTVTPFSIMGMIMFIFIKIIEVYVMESVAGLLIKIAAGAVIYCILSGVYIVMFNKDTRVLIAKKNRGRREK